MAPEGSAVYEPLAPETLAAEVGSLRRFESPLDCPQAMAAATIAGPT